MTVNRYLDFATRIVSRAARLLLAHFGQTDTSLRGSAKGIKTVHDRLADEVITGGIERTFPTHSYLTEETGLVDKGSPYLWIVDPLDGTKNFVNANPFFSVSIALWVNGRPQLGVIEAPVLQERYLAVAKRGARVVDLRRRRTIRARVSSVRDLSRSYLLYCAGGVTDRRRTLRLLRQLYPTALGMRVFGSAALELAWVGAGRADAYVTPSISLWDIAAGVLFVTEAGGRILDFKGRAYRWPELARSGRVNLLATNGKLNLPPIRF